MNTSELKSCISDLLIYLEDHKFDLFDSMQELCVSYNDLRSTLLNCTPSDDVDLDDFKTSSLWFPLNRAISIIIDIVEKNKKVA